jgi:hypothetical protein
MSKHEHVAAASSRRVHGTSVGAGALAAAVVVNPEEERQYWRDNFQHQDHYAPGYEFDDYAPAYALGYSRYGQYRDWAEAEAQLGGEWDNVKQRSRLSWAHAREATRAAWEKVERAASAGSSHTDDAA